MTMSLDATMEIVHMYGYISNALESGEFLKVICFVRNQRLGITKSWTHDYSVNKFFMYLKERKKHYRRLLGDLMSSLRVKLKVVNYMQ